MSASGNTGYTQAIMAKVMVSIPDDLLKQLDSEAERRGMTRSGILRDFADQALRRHSANRASRNARVMRGASDHGGRVAELVKKHRPG